MIVLTTTKIKPLGGSPVMAIIPQMSLFSWTDVEELGDLDRLRLLNIYLTIN